MEKLWDCKYCKLSFHNGDEYVEHMDKVHSESLEADDI